MSTNLIPTRILIQTLALLQMSMGVFTMVTMCANINFLHLPLRLAFRATLQSQNLFVGCLITCDVQNTVLRAFKNSSISATALF